FSTSPFSWTSLTTLYPGNYSIILSASNSDTTNRSVVAAIKIPVGDSRDNYAAHLAGVAPASKIVALKVLDDNGLGNSADLLSALNWIHVNGKN
ncbi:MAG TPA: hypothetical protein VKK79_24185, partial [Candidatus Lokiarchaeia archaeon]|nr:hypothetical protein [Candidatus Lokiarchaeia archaeon]